MVPDIMCSSHTMPEGKILDFRASFLSKMLENTFNQSGCFKGARLERREAPLLQRVATFYIPASTL